MISDPTGLGQICIRRDVYVQKAYQKYLRSDGLPRREETRR